MVKKRWSTMGCPHLKKKKKKKKKNVFTIKSFFTQRTYDAEISRLIAEKKTLDMMTIFVENTFQNIALIQNFYSVKYILKVTINKSINRQQFSKLAIINFDVSISISTKSHIGGTTLSFSSLIWPWAAVKLT